MQESQTPQLLDSGQPQRVQYCIPNWLKLEQIKLNLTKCSGRIEVAKEPRSDPIALVSFGPSLRDTWEEIKEFKYVMSCSGSHKFLVERGIVPTWHCLPADAMVSTEVGLQRMKQIYDSAYSGRVLAFDVQTGQFAWKKILNRWSRSSRGLGKQWVDLNFSARGNKTNLLCTDDHMIATLGDVFAPWVRFRQAKHCAGEWVVRLPYSKSKNQRENALFNDDQIAALIGVMLGDGNIKKDGIFRCTHGDVQREYLNFKHRLFGGRIESSRQMAWGKRHSRGILVCPINGQTKELRRVMYRGGKKILPKSILGLFDERSLAFWYLDDGSLAKGDGKSRPFAIFCTDGFSKVEVKRIADHMANRWGVSPRVKKVRVGYRIRLRADDSETVFRLIAKYVPNSMEYKLPKKFRGGPKYTFNTKPLQFSAEQVREVNKKVVIRGRWHGGRLYDLEVEDAHTFVANDCVVHNCDVDPREHKIKLIGEPQKRCEYLIASTCHPKLIDFLQDAGCTVKLWHIFDNEEEGFRIIPRNEWLVTGGCSCGVRTMTVARFLGFTDLHIFGMDGSYREGESHAANHPNGGSHKKHYETEYGGVKYRTSPSMLEAARNTWHELDMLKDVKTTFYGSGLVQAMSKDYKRKEFPAKSNLFIGFNKPELISADYCDLNRRLHKDNLAYGVGGGRHAESVIGLVRSLKKDSEFVSVLDFGCGKGYLAKALPFPIAEYDPAIPGKDESPRPADLVVATDVLEHVEPDKLRFVLDEIRRCTRRLAFFVIHTGPSSKTLADGRNTHLIQRPKNWWHKILKKFFTVAKDSIKEVPPLLYVVVAAKEKKPKPNDTALQRVDGIRPEGGLGVPGGTAFNPQPNGPEGSGCDSTYAQESRSAGVACPAY